MRRAKTPSFTWALALLVNGHARRDLDIRFNYARNVYNAVLTVARRRARVLRDSRLYRQAKALPKGKPGSPERKSRAAAFAEARTVMGLTDGAIEKVADDVYRRYGHEHLGSHICRAMGRRALQAVDGQFFHGGRHASVKRWDGVDSIESGTGQDIHWKGYRVAWAGLSLPAKLDPANARQAHALSCPVKYVRLVRRQMGQQTRYFAQLVLAGRPMPGPRAKAHEGVVGIDVNLTTVAAVGDARATLMPLAPIPRLPRRQQRRLQRQADRQRRANNPDNYDEAGRTKKGSRHWHRSKRQHLTQRRLADVHRRVAAGRKARHGYVANQVLRLGNDLRIEHVDGKDWQHMHGRHVEQHGPSDFVRRLAWKLTLLDGHLVDIPTSTALSSTCVCGVVSPKKLSQRVHDCVCGVIAQRDLFSAFLSRYVVIDERGCALLHADQAHAAWSGVGPLLRAAWMEAPQRARRQGLPVPPAFGRFPREWLESEPVARVSGSVTVEAPDAVGGNAESRGEAVVVATSSPPFGVDGKGFGRRVGAAPSTGLPNSRN